VEQFFRNDVCDNYLELLKGRLHDQRPEAAQARRAAQAGLHEALSIALRLFAPFVPHVAEVLWQALFAARQGVPSVARAPWPAPPAAWADAASESHGAAAVAVLTAVRRWRSENKVSPGTPLARAHLKAGAGAAAQWRPLAGDVRAALRVADLLVEADAALAADAVTVAAVTTA
jgi:valyl-tRNA synthetase